MRLHVESTHDLEQVLARREIVQRLRELFLGHGHALEELDRHRPVVQTDDEERHVLNNSLASSTRPVRTSSTMPPSNADCQLASSEERPERRNCFPRLGENVEQGLVLRSDLLFQLAAQLRRQRRAPATGSDADDEVAAPDHRHQRKGAVGRIVCTVDPDPARLARRVHGGVDRGVVGGGEREPRALEVGGLERPLAQHEPARVGPGPDLGADLGRDHLDHGARVEQRLDLAGRDAPGADDHHPAVAHQQVHRVAGEPRAPRRRTVGATGHSPRPFARGAAPVVPRRSW